MTIRIARPPQNSGSTGTEHRTPELLHIRAKWRIFQGAFAQSERIASSRKAPAKEPPLRASPKSCDPRSGGALLAAKTHNDTGGDIRHQVEYKYADFVKRHAGVMNRVKLSA
jgi:hypothetical protein